MASFAAFLEVGGQRYPLLSYALSIHQQTDSLGRPASPTLGGTIDCTLSALGADKPFLMQWMFSPTMQQDGKIVLMQEAPEATLKTVSFFNAYCTGLQSQFMPGATGGGSLQVQVRVSPQRIAVGAIVHDNNWPLESHGAGETFAKQTVSLLARQPLAQPEETPSIFAEGVHTALDIIGMIPLLGEVADGANAALYAAQGDYMNAALSAAAMVPGVGNVATGVKWAKKGARLLGKARGLKQVKKLWRSGVDLMEKGDAWVGKLQRGSTGFLGSPRLSRSQLSKFREQAQSLGANLEIVKDKAMIKFMDAKKAQAGFNAMTNKLFVRKGATYYEVSHEMTHAKHCAELGQEAYSNLNRLQKETHVFDELMKQRKKLTPREIEHATGYINDIRKDFGLDPLTLQR